MEAADIAALCDDTAGKSSHALNCHGALRELIRACSLGSAQAVNRHLQVVFGNELVVCSLPAGNRENNSPQHRPRCLFKEEVMVQSVCTLTEVGEKKKNARALYGSKVNNVLAF